MDGDKILILLVEDNKDFSKLLDVYLQRYERDRFHIIWKEHYNEAIAEIESNKNIDVVLMDYFLPGKNGLEITKELLERKVSLPIVFLSVNKDFDVVLKVMKLGVADYLGKEEISSPVLPKTIMSVIEKHKLRLQLLQAEISRNRLHAIQEKLNEVIDDLERPLREMVGIVSSLHSLQQEGGENSYVKILDENLLRISSKLDKLKSLKEAKTVQYIKDIRMLDLS